MEYQIRCGPGVEAVLEAEGDFESLGLNPLLPTIGRRLSENDALHSDGLR